MQSDLFILHAAAVNPHPSRQGLSTVTLPNGRVFSCQPDGSSQDRDPGADGPYETCQMAGNVATFKPGDTFYTFAVVLVDKL